MYDWVNSDGLGSFMCGQIVADLKYLPFMKQVDDWWTWATPGPGSSRGLNIVLGRAINDPWKKGEWLIELQKLGDSVTPWLEEVGIEKLHNQDLQNCLCEFSKFTKVARGIGRPRQVFRHREA
jgi:5-hmdU DNA kinase, helical domain